MKNNVQASLISITIISIITTHITTNAMISEQSQLRPYHNSHSTKNPLITVKMQQYYPHETRQCIPNIGIRCALHNILLSWRQCHLFNSELNSDPFSIDHSSYVLNDLTIVDDAFRFCDSANRVTVITHQFVDTYGTNIVVYNTRFPFGVRIDDFDSIQNKAS